MDTVARHRAGNDTADPNEDIHDDKAANEPEEEHDEGHAEEHDEGHAEEHDDKPWQKHDNGRWMVGDPGSQERVVAQPSDLAQSRPDIIVDAGRAGGVEFRAVSLRGLSHLETGKPRQDAYLVMATRDDNWLVGCVADGVSEGRLSHLAADVVCAKVTEALREALHRWAPGDDKDLRELPWDQAVERANAAIQDEFLRRLNKRRDADRVAAEEVTDADVRAAMSSTAVAFVAATRPRPDGLFPAAVTVVAGDSSALLLRGGQWHPVTDVKGAGQEVASGAVRPLPRRVSPEPVAHTLARGDVLLVITDGVGDPMGSGQGEVGQFFAAQWTEPPDPLAFAQQVGFYRKSFVDDRTAVAVWVGAGSR